MITKERLIKFLNIKLSDFNTELLEKVNNEGLYCVIDITNRILIHNEVITKNSWWSFQPKKQGYKYFITLFTFSHQKQKYLCKPSNKFEIDINEYHKILDLLEIRQAHDDKKEDEDLIFKIDKEIYNT